MRVNYKHSKLTSKILRAYFDVYNALGPGFFEKVYMQAMCHELRERGLEIQREAPIEVYYKGKVVGKYYADILIENCVILELKAIEKIHPVHEAQLVNYLKASDIEVGLVLNFGPKPEFRRKVCTSDFKKRK